MDICFILVRPSFLGNIGSTARVLKNFGFSNLRLVAPPKNYKDAEARKMSLGAFDLLKNAEVFETLSDALKDVNYAIGSSCGTQREIKSISTFELPNLIKEISAQSKRTAFIFGEERDGLTKEELNRCDLIISIPTDAEFPSLNVAQAIGVVAYELRRITFQTERGGCKTVAESKVESAPNAATGTVGVPPAPNAASATNGSANKNAQVNSERKLSASNAADSTNGSAGFQPASNCSENDPIPAPNSSAPGTAGIPLAPNEAKQSDEPVPATPQAESTYAHPSTSLSNIFTTGEIDDDLFQQLDLLLHEVGFSRSFNRESVLTELRRLYQRAKPSERESGMLQGMIRKINSKLNFEKS